MTFFFAGLVALCVNSQVLASAAVLDPHSPTIVLFHKHLYSLLIAETAGAYPGYHLERDVENASDCQRSDGNTMTPKQCFRAILRNFLRDNRDSFSDWSSNRLNEDTSWLFRDFAATPDMRNEILAFILASLRED